MKKRRRVCGPGYGTDHVENLEQHGLGDGGVKLANVKGSRGGGSLGSGDCISRGRRGERGHFGRWESRFWLDDSG